jgi:hypothetical protein
VNKTRVKTIINHGHVEKGGLLLFGIKGLGVH